jgi:hypothetical protein
MSKPSRSPHFEPRSTCSRSKSPSCKPNWRSFRDEASFPLPLETILLADPTNEAVKESHTTHDQCYVSSITQTSPLKSPSTRMI